MEKQKVIIVGASHGGHQSALELLDKYDNVDVTIYEAGDFVSFMSCGMQLYLEDKATAKDDVRNFAPADLEAKGGRIFNNHQVTKINADKKTVIVKDVLTDQEEEVSYDKLILSSGVTPQTLPVPGNDLENIYLMRGYDWAGKIKSALNNPAIKNVAVIGAGNIGIEAVEVFANAGRNVTLLDMIDKPMGNYVNDELADLVAAELEKHHVTQVLGAKIEAFEGDGKVTAIKTDKGQVDTDLVIVAAGVKPNTKWLEGTVDLTDRALSKQMLTCALISLMFTQLGMLSYHGPSQVKLTCPSLWQQPHAVKPCILPVTSLKVSHPVHLKEWWALQHLVSLTYTGLQQG